MNKLIKFLLIGFVLVMFFATVKGAIAGHDCDLRGGYYHCDSDNTVSGTINLLDKGIYLDNMDIVITGANGDASVEDGSDGALSIQTTGKILVENTNITLTGGNGYSKNCIDGGDGGSAVLEFSNFSNARLINVTLDLSGGTGANGDACLDPNSTDDGDAVSGGKGGAGDITFSGDYLYSERLNISLSSGNSGDAEAKCKGDDEADKDGTFSFDNEFNTDLNTLIFNGSIEMNAGTGGDADADTCGGGRRSEGKGGDGGSNVFDIYSNNASIYGPIISNTGNGGDAYARDSYDDSGADDGGDSGITTFYLNSLVLDYGTRFEHNPGTPGYLDCDAASWGADAQDGSVGIVDFQIDTNISTFKNSIIFNTNSFSGNCEECDDGTQRPTCSDSPSNIFKITSPYSTVLEDLTIDLTTNKGYIPTVGSDDGDGGNAGALTFLVDSENIDLINSTINILTGDGGDGDGSGSNHYNGIGGNINIGFTGKTKIYDSFVDFVSGDSGQKAGLSTSTHGAGNIYFDNEGGIEINNSDFFLSTGKNGPGGKSGVAGRIDFAAYNFSGYDSKIIFNKSLSGATSGDYMKSTINQNFYLYNSSFDFVSDASVGDCLSPTFLFEDISLFETFNSSIYGYTNAGSGTCDVVLNGTGEEFNFLNNTRVELTSDIGGGGVVTFVLSSDNIGLPGIMRWNYTETGDAITANVYSNETSYNGSRGSLTETGTWNWNHTPNNVVYDDYFTRIQEVGFQKVSGDKGPDIYNYTNFTCKAKTTLGDYFVGTPLYNFTIYKNGVSQDTSNDVSITDDSFVNATFEISGVDTVIGEVWNCSVIAYEDTFENKNNTQKSINYTYPYNVTVWVGQKKSSAGTITTGYLIDDVNLTVDRGTINEYIQQNCSSSPCLVPVEFRSSTNSKINVTRLNVTYGTNNPINENVTGFYNVPLIFNSSREGQLIVEDAYFVYSTNETDIEISGTTVLDTISKYISVLYSRFNLNLTPTFIEYYDVYPLWLSQQNVEPYGQSSDVSIFNITRINSANHTFELRMKIDNGTGNDCTEVWFSTNNSKTNAYKMVEGNYTYFKNMTWNDVNETELWSWVDFNNCNSSEVRYFWPEFIVKSKANGTVDTVGFWDD